MIAAIVVHYRTPALLHEAVHALRRTEVDVIVVDNGGGDLPELPATVVRAPRNLGYAGGINLGVRQTDAEHLVVMNADVVVDPGCLERLARALDEGYGAAGPRQYWDREHTFLLPPLEVHTRGAEWLRRAAPPRWARARWREHAWRHWKAEATIASPWLSGSLLAISREAWRAVGPFDEDYRLYFEEVDWLSRLWRAGYRSAYVPQATAVHLYDQSARGAPEARARFEQSRRRFQRQHYGGWFRGLLRLTPRFPHPRSVRRPADAPIEVGRPCWAEIAVAPAGFPAAGAWLPAGTWRLPDSLQQQMAPGWYTLTLVDADGREQRRFAVEVAGGPRATDEPRARLVS
jgi:GT2 family glycosyltransferase